MFTEAQDPIENSVMSKEQTLRYESILTSFMFLYIKYAHTHLKRSPKPILKGMSEMKFKVSYSIIPQ